jgi:membrane protease YdiL (CAAX protease family)
MSDAPKPPAKPPAPKPALGEERNSDLMWDVVRKRPNPLVSIAFTVPVFLVYHLGVLVIDRRHDVDFISTLVQKLLDASLPAYVLVTLALALALLVITWVQQKRGKAEIHLFRRVFAESLGAALLILMSIGWATHEVRTGEALSIPYMGFLEKLILAAGAGFHEEFIFRALLITGASWVLTKLTKWKHWVSLLVCSVISSVLFSLAHYFVLADEAFVMQVAGFRVLEGLLFAGLYITRGFATVVYAHALYDLMAFYLYS